MRFARADLKVGLYHSLLDWHHEEYPIDGLHPQRDDEAFKAQHAGRRIDKYADFLHGQVRELLTHYGKIDYLWFDFSYPQEDWGWSKGKGAADWRSAELERLVLELQPDIILNDRLDLGRGVRTPEQYQPSQPVTQNGKPVIWEACQTLNGSWGYDRDNFDYKPPNMLAQMLIDTVSKGGNLLLNVGPTGRGELDGHALSILKEIGRWTRRHGRSVYGAGASVFAPPTDCRYTQNGDRLYLHIFAWPFRHIHLKGLEGRIRYAQFLHDGSEIKMIEHEGQSAASHIEVAEEAGTVTLELPVGQPDVLVPVVELLLK